MKKKRVYRKAKPKAPKGYDSVFEYDLHKGMLKDWSFHPELVRYSVPHTYEPDFKKTIGNKTILIEAKGRLRDSADARRYLFIREALAEDEELVFLFYKADTPMPHSKRRKDGTKLTHGEWAEKNNFRYSCMKENFDVEQYFQ